MKSSIYFRVGQHVDTEEYDVAAKYFQCYPVRSLIEPNHLIIPRYSALPFYQELETDIKNMGSVMLNTYEQHRFIADIRNYQPYLADITPAIYPDGWDKLPEGSYVVKGLTNSRKQHWNTRMFCQTKKDIQSVVRSLLDDALIADQGLVVRPYIPLKTYTIGINGLPITNEWRFFCLGGTIISSGFYWGSESDYQWKDGVLPTEGDVSYARAPEKAYDLAHRALGLVQGKCPFVVIDIAETAAGDWIVVELNDGQQSGLGATDPDLLYKNLLEEVNKQY